MVRFGAVGAPVVLLPPEEQPLFRRTESLYRESDEAHLEVRSTGYGSTDMGRNDAAADAAAPVKPRACDDFVDQEPHTATFEVEGSILPRTASFIEDSDASSASCHNPLHDHCGNGCGGDDNAAAAAANGGGDEIHGPGAHQHLKLLPLAVLVFYNVSGGPFGIEATVRAGGNFFAIMGFLLLPLVWSVPEALVTAELGSAFPEASGGVAWVEEAFGRRVGLMSGYFNWVAGATDNAIYPALFLEYVTSAISSTSDDYDKDELASGWVRFVVVSGIAVVLAGINYTGLEIVGTASIVVCVLSMSPFVIMCLIGIPQIDPRKWLQMPEPDESAGDLFDDDSETLPGPMPLVGLAGVFWRPFLNNLFWNLNSFDSAGSFAGEVRDVSTTYPRGIFLGLLMIVAFYLIPLMVATGATDSTQEEWVDGHIAAVSVEIGGPWLGAWIVFAAGISNLSLFEAEMSADAYQLMGMAERGYLPKIFATRSRKFGTPTYGIVAGTLVIVAMSVADFSQLVEMLNFTYALSLLLEYAAFAKLRYTHRHVERPYRAPIPDWGAILLVLPPSIMTVLLFMLSSWLTYAYVISVLALGLGLHHVQLLARKRKWCEFAPQKYSELGMDTIEVVSRQKDIASGGGANEEDLHLNEDGVIT